jgi:hypothetical protein
MTRLRSVMYSLVLALPLLCGCGGEESTYPVDKRTPEELQQEQKAIDAAHADTKKAHDAMEAKKK